MQIAQSARGELNLAEACRLLDLNRSTVYYHPSLPEDEVWLMNLIRDIWLRYSFYGYRKITHELRIVHHQIVNSKRVLRLMRQMQIKAIYPEPYTSRKDEGSRVYPYLLKELVIDRPNQVLMIDITYLRLGNQFVYLIAFIDVFSRFVVGWHLSHDLNTESCVKALYNALTR